MPFGILEGDLTGFLDARKKSLDYQPPCKSSPFLMKEINKEIMTRSRLRNKFLRCRSHENKKAYYKQHNCCVKLIRKAKKLIIATSALKTLKSDSHLSTFFIFTSMIAL